MNAAILIRNLTVLVACQLLGSACAPSTVQLIKEAHENGDWSRVEKQQDAELKRQAGTTSLVCADGQVGVCSGSEKLSQRECVCAHKASLRRAFTSHSR